MWTKAQLIDKAFAELALAGYVYDLSPEIREDALQTLDAMMAEWSASGIAIGYLLPATPDDSNIDDDSGIPDTANQAVYMNLAVSLAAGRGKTLTPRTLLAASKGYNRLLGVAARAAARQVAMPNTMPLGAGNKPWRGGLRFFPGPAETLDTSTGGDAITLG
jgi:hypothetical protein